jgi:hypothetical protein
MAGETGEHGEQSGAQPSEEELRDQLEEEIRKVRVEDVVLQSAVSILNLAARRLTKDDERDLAQARVGIEAARALTGLCPEDARPQLQQAVSELQLLYAKQAEGESGERAAGGEAAATEGAEAPRETPPKEPPDGPKRDSGLWTPG